MEAGSYFLHTVLTKSDESNHPGKLPRDDYRECAELTLILLGEVPPRGVHWMKPGAYHHARWMSTVIYAAKMYAFGNQLQYDQVKIDKLHRICLFNALIYIRAWLSATSARDAPVNDLQLWNDLNKYSQVDPGVADAARTALQRHLWYVTEELAPFALFSPLVSDSDKKEIVQQLMKSKDDAPLVRGVPKFPNLIASTTVPSLIGRNSWLLFNRLQSNTNWFQLPPEQWASDSDYQAIDMFVRHVHVVNDLSERSIKLITDFASTITHDENQRQFLLQCVEQHRRTVSDFRKESLKNI
jgi:hypothetical protein